jgi:hypothetical protein
MHFDPAPTAATAESAAVGAVVVEVAIMTAGLIMALEYLHTIGHL